MIYYTVFHKKGTRFLSFIIQSNDDRLTRNFYQMQLKKILIQNFLDKMCLLVKYSLLVVT